MKIARMLTVLTIVTGCSAPAAEEASTTESPLGTVALDPSFGTAGRLVLSRGGAMQVLPDGRIVVLDSDRVLHRFLANGAVDTSFGGEPEWGWVGKKYIGKDPCYPTTIAVAPDGAILVAGTKSGPLQSICVERYDSAGARDMTFGSGGIAFGSPMGKPWDPRIAVSPQGAIAIGASFKVGQDAWGQPIVAAQILQLSANGALTSEVKPAPEGQRAVNGLAFDAAGGLLASGSAQNGFTTTPAVARYVGGALDTTFGTLGYAQIDFSGVAAGNKGYDCVVAADPQGGSLVDCNLSLFIEGTGIVRLTADGKIDPSFGQAGYTKISGFQPKLTVDDQHRLVTFVNGWVSSVSLKTSASLVRLTAAGAPDATFAPGGSVTVPGCASTSCNVDWFAVRPNDTYLVMRGYSSFGGEILRFTVQ